MHWVMFLATVALATWGTHQSWKNLPLSNSMLDAAFGRSLSRAMGRSSLTFLLIFLAAAPPLLVRGDSPAVRLLLLLPLALALIADVGVVLFNRPRFLVPPQARDDDGLVTLWVARLRDLTKR